MLKVGILFEEQIHKMAVAELIDKHQKELELIKEALRNRFTVKRKALNSFLEEAYKKTYVTKIEIYSEDSIPKYIKRNGFLYRIEE